MLVTNGVQGLSGTFCKTLFNFVRFRLCQEMDPRTICWKGGAVLSILDSAQELWISQREWLTIGVRVLRERSPFIWTICS